MNAIELIKSDLKRICKPTFKNAIKYYFFPQGTLFRYQVWLRIIHDVKKKKFSKILFGPFIYFVFRHYEFKYGIHCNSNIEIGEGLCIMHGDGVYLNCKSIGDNFTVYQNVTLGKFPGRGIPIVKNDVTIFPSAVICGDIVLNNKCIVGALTYVSKDVGEGEKIKGK